MSFKSFITSEKPGKGLYIFVFFVASIPANLIVIGVDTILAESILKSIDDWNTYAIISFPIEVIVYLVFVTSIYKKFQNIKISKVMPYIWIFGGINFAKIYYTTTPILESAGIGTTVNTFMILIGYLWLCFGFRQHFKNSRQW